MQQLSRLSVGSLLFAKTWADMVGGQGVRTPPPPEQLQNIGFLSNTGPDPLKNHKAQCLATITSFKWRFAGGAMMARF